MNSKLNSVDEYILSFPIEVQYKLKLLRKTIKEKAPHASESIAYGMPAYKVDGKPLVYFGCFDKHVGLYPTPLSIDKFKEELAEYVSGKGSVQFPLNKPLPLDLIGKIIRYKLTALNKT